MNHDLDHVALGLRAAQPVLDGLVERLGAEVVHGGFGPGFRGVQVRVGAEGMVVELLEPHMTEVTDFLVRFLDRHGEGPHHLTFLVDDLAAEIDRLRRIGIEPLGIDLTNPVWKECFLLPEVAHGTVVQVAETTLKGLEFEGLDWPSSWWEEPPSRGRVAATLRRVVLGTPEPETASEFFAGALGGTPDGDDLVWSSGGRIRIERSPQRGISRLEVVGLEGELVIGGGHFVGTDR